MNKVGLPGQNRLEHLGANRRNAGAARIKDDATLDRTVRSLLFNASELAEDRRAPNIPGKIFERLKFSEPPVVDVRLDDLHGLRIVINTHVVPEVPFFGPEQVMIFDFLRADGYENPRLGKRLGNPRRRALPKPFGKRSRGVPGPEGPAM